MRLKSTAALSLAAFTAAAALAGAVLAVFGAGERGTDIALQATARLSFLLFLPAYTASALAVLFGARFRPLQRQARALGLGFAAAQLVHAGLVVWLCWIGAAPAAGVFVLFGIALVWVYLLALFSLAPLQQMLGPAGWFWLRTIGMNYIAYAFAVDFLKYPLSGGPKHIALYFPFALLSLAGPVLYFTGLAVSRLRAGKAAA